MPPPDWYWSTAPKAKGWAPPARHQNQRHQRAGAVAGDPADDRRDERHGRDEGKLRHGDVGKNRGQRFEHRAKSYTNKSYTKRPSALTNPPPYAYATLGKTLLI